MLLVIYLKRVWKLKLVNSFSGVYRNGRDYVLHGRRNENDNETDI